MYIKHFFKLIILLQSHLINHSRTQSEFIDTQTSLEHSKHSESTRAPGHL